MNSIQPNCSPKGELNYDFACMNVRNLIGRWVIRCAPPKGRSPSSFPPRPEVILSVCDHSLTDRIRVFQQLDSMEKEMDIDSIYNHDSDWDDDQWKKVPLEVSPLHFFLNKCHELEGYQEHCFGNVARLFEFLFYSNVRLPNLSPRDPLSDLKLSCSKIANANSENQCVELVTQLQKTFSKV